MKFYKDKFIPKHPEKYIGKRAPVYRSAWEYTMMTICDNHPGILQWASEPFRIPYENPITHKKTIYVPDFLIIYIDKNKKQHAEVVEIKPNSQFMIEKARSKADKIALTINAAKWQTAYLWCKKNGFNFRVVSEDNLFGRKK